MHAGDLNKVVRYQPQTFEPHFTGPPSEYQGTPSPELDARWYKLSSCKEPCITMDSSHCDQGANEFVPQQYTILLSTAILLSKRISWKRTSSIQILQHTKLAWRLSTNYIVWYSSVLSCVSIRHWLRVQSRIISACTRKSPITRLSTKIWKRSPTKTARNTKVHPPNTYRYHVIIASGLFRLTPFSSDHCVEILRQRLTCMPDLQIYTYHWEMNHDMPFADLRTNHQCINWNSFSGWVDKHVMHSPTLHRPAGAEMLTDEDKWGLQNYGQGP